MRMTRYYALLLALACSSSASPPDARPGDASADGSRDGPVGPVTMQPLIILHTNDLHSHLMGFGPEADYSPATADGDGTVGGLARLAARIAADRAAAGATPVLLLDAGDFMMGTPFHLLGPTAAAELVEMGKLKYDAITIGNHELDWGPLALAGILGAATGRGFTVPLLASNMTFSDSDPGDDALASFLTSGVLKRKLVKDVGVLKVGFFGILGKDASDVAPLKRPLTFENIAITARAAIKELRQTDKVDLVIALSHSGIDEKGAGEDRRLAEDAMVRAAGGIDVIISGHTHDKLDAPAQVGKTLIVQAGSYGRYLGKLQLVASKSAAGTTVALTKYDLEAIDDSVAGDAATQAAVEGYIAALDMALAPAGLAYRKVIGETSVDINAVPYAESGIGDLVADAYLASARALQPMAPPVIAIDAAGDIRDDVLKGKNGRLWFADLFRVQPLGIAPDRQPGFPLVTFYVNGKDLKAGFELSAAAQTLGKSDYFLQVAGMGVKLIGNGPLFKRVESLKIGDTPVDLASDTPCYKVVTNIYVASLLGVVESVTGGLLAVKPKQADCQTPVTDLTAQIVDGNPATPAVEQLKAWQALIGYVSALPDTNGNMIPDLPAVYGKPPSPGRILITYFINATSRR
jgi:5'-nucleotidase/UDP-sugar diphosphatase